MAAEACVRISNRDDEAQGGARMYGQNMDSPPRRGETPDWNSELGGGTHAVVHAFEEPNFLGDVVGEVGVAFGDLPAAFECGAEVAAFE